VARAGSAGEADAAGGGARKGRRGASGGGVWGGRELGLEVDPTSVVGCMNFK
jgi:hypothetical protein